MGYTLYLCLTYRPFSAYRSTICILHDQDRANDVLMKADYEDQLQVNVFSFIQTDLRLVNILFLGVKTLSNI